MVQEVIGMCCVQSLQMNDIKRNNTCIKHFVRKHLGCVCPDKVFENITVTEQTDIFPSVNTIYEIGGRLFVAVFVPADWHDMARHLGKLVDAGKRFRDQHGYNRFRLVVAIDNDEAKTNLHKVFENLPGVDEKTHLHVIKPEHLPRPVYCTKADTE